jgi:hypothetical protein
MMLLEHNLAHVDFRGQAIAEVQAPIERSLSPYEKALDLLQTIPGVKPNASAILAEIGPDMSLFPALDTWHLGWAQPE